jgi:hypothetical protein
MSSHCESLPGRSVGLSLLGVTIGCVDSAGGSQNRLPRFHWRLFGLALPLVIRGGIRLGKDLDARSDQRIT